jgi:hypothetical protein
MRRIRSLLIVGLVLSALPAASAQAGVRIGIGLGFPICVGGPCYYPAPVYYVPGPYYVTSPTVVVQQPVVQQPVAQPAPPAPGREETAPPPKPVQPQAAAQPEPLPEAVILKPVTATRAANGDVEHYLGRLADADEGVRLDAVTRLGRLRAAQACDPLAATLACDQSPAVREAAARSLAILGDPKALPALLRAAQGDSDRDVRRAAQFAVDVIQTR